MEYRLFKLAFALFATMLVVACSGGGEVSIHDLEPRDGPAKGKQRVKIHGENFRTDIGYTVYFGNEKAPNVTIVDSGTLLVQAPKHEEPKTVDVMIAADNGPAWKIHDAFTYKEAAGSVMEKMGEGQEKGKLKY